MTTRRAASLVLLMAVAIGIAIGCSDSTTPTGPKLTTSPTPTPAPLASEVWNLTDEVTAVSGPSFCVNMPSVGMVFGTTFTLSRTSSSVSFLFADPLDWESYEASVSGLNFAAATPTVDSGRGMCTHYRQMYSLTGSFSADGSHLTATEVWSFTLDSGDVKTVTFHWTASRQ